jgi:threonine/homoserine/homoserine lactone efflux protein
MISLTEIGQYLPGILLSYAALLVGLISPGPALLGLMGVSLDRGRHAGQRFALGIGTGSFSIGLLTLTGLSALLATYADAMTAIRIFGGLYLLWMSYRAFRTAFRKMPVANANDANNASATSPAISGRSYYLRGLALHLTNPKAILTWIAIISIGFQDGAPMWVGAAIVVGCGLLSTSVHLVYATAFSTAPAISIYRRAAGWINGLLGVFFATVGLRLLFNR